MDIRNALLVDCETTGLDDDAHLIEIGAILYSVEYRTILAQLSCLIPAPSNDAQHINGITPEILDATPWSANISSAFLDLLGEAQIVCGHNISFDAQFIKRQWMLYPEPIWVDTQDMNFPHYSKSRTLVDIALAHGVGVLSAHRALTDCDIMARLFTALGDGLQASIEYAMRPRALFAAQVDFNQRQLAKDHGFTWEPEPKKRWVKRLIVGENYEFPFFVRQV